MAIFSTGVDVPFRLGDHWDPWYRLHGVGRGRWAHRASAVDPETGGSGVDGVVFHVETWRKIYNVGPPSDGTMVYKPHEYYSYRYHKP